MPEYSLYVKQHNITGLKYLGQTYRDPEKYKGSGLLWKRHIKVYGNDVSTYVIATCNTKNELRDIGLYYSKGWNVVKSNDWANLKEEAGDGNPPGIQITKEARMKISLASKGKPKSKEHNRKNSESQRGKKHPHKGRSMKGNKNPFFGKNHTEESKQKMSEFWKGNQNWLGRKHTDETKRKISESHKRNNINV